MEDEVDDKLVRCCNAKTSSPFTGILLGSVVCCLWEDMIDVDGDHYQRLELFSLGSS